MREGRTPLERQQDTDLPPPCWPLQDPSRPLQGPTRPLQGPTRPLQGPPRPLQGPTRPQDPTTWSSSGGSPALGHRICKLGPRSQLLLMFWSPRSTIKSPQLGLASCNWIKTKYVLVCYLQQQQQAEIFIKLGKSNKSNSPPQVPNCVSSCLVWHVL